MSVFYKFNSLYNKKITPAHQLTSSPAHQLTSSPAHQLTSSPAHQLTSSPAHQLTSSPAHQLTSVAMNHPRKTKSLFNWLARVTGTDSVWIEGIEHDNKPIWALARRLSQSCWYVVSRFAKATAALAVVGGALLLPTHSLHAQSGFDLINLTGANGITFHGLDWEDRSGGAIASGDINGDGIDDVIIGAHQADPNGSRSGEIYVVFGTSTPFASSVKLDTLDGSSGFILHGIDGGDISGFSVASGDINGDGVDDVIIGAPAGGSNGETYVVFGKSTAFSSIVELSSLDGSTGFVVGGDNLTDTDRIGSSVASGDIDGDGYDDLIIGAPLSGDNYGYYGDAHVVFGFNDTTTDTLELSSLDGTTGFVLRGHIYEGFSGNAVASGDINGDGYDEVIIGAPNDSGINSEAYVVFGKSTAFASSIELSSLDGSTGFTFGTGPIDTFYGNAVSSGDVNGDGYDDLIIGAQKAEHPNPTHGNASDEGLTFVVFGKSTTFASKVERSSLDGNTGFTIHGVDFDDNSGSAVASGDVNGDGRQDMIIGAYGADPNGSNSGETYVVFGQSSFASTLELSSLNGSTGYVLNGIKSLANSGIAVAVGDINGDGRQDVIIGSPGADVELDTNLNEGETYVFTQFPEAGELTGSEGFRMLAAPASGTILDEFLAPLWTQGMTGADASNGGANVWVWDETAGIEGSWSAVSDLAGQDVAHGQGFLMYVYSDDDFDGTTEGFPKVLNTIDIFNSTVVDTGTVTPVSSLADGRFFLAGNPYPSTFDWDSSAVSKTNLSNAIYIYDHANALWQTWNGFAGNITEGRIVPFQSFFIQALGGAGTLRIGDGSQTNSSGTFFKPLRDQEPKALKIDARAGDIASKAWLSFQQGGELGRDAFDALSLRPLGTPYLRLATVIESEEELQINALPVGHSEELRFPLILMGILDSTVASLSFEGLEKFTGWDIAIHDLDTEEVYELAEDDDTLSLAIQKEKTKPSSPERLLLPVPGKAKADGYRFELVLTPSTQVFNEPVSGLPEHVKLEQNYPNPFNPVTTITYLTPRQSSVRLEVFDVMGRKVTTLVDNERQTPGRYTVRFDASSLASGVYFYRLTVGNTVQTRKLTLLK